MPKDALSDPTVRMSRKQRAEKTSTDQRTMFEKELYEPFEEWIRHEFKPDPLTLFNQGIFEVVTCADRRKNSRKWEVPDLVALSYRRYKYVPNVQMDLISFELKRKSEAFKPLGIFEAVSQSKLFNYAYYCFEWSNDEMYRGKAGFKRIQEEAELHGVGLIHMHWADTGQRHLSAAIILEARRREPPPGKLHDLVEVYFPRKVKDEVARYVANSHKGV